jgi:site-specific DNA-cytosine methylase
VDAQEKLILQGFGRSYRLAKCYGAAQVRRMIANAIPPPVMRGILGLVVPGERMREE